MRGACAGMALEVIARFLLLLLGNDAGPYFLDLKNGSGSCGAGEPSNAPDVTFALKDSDFKDMFQGRRKFVEHVGHCTIPVF